MVTANHTECSYSEHRRRMAEYTGHIKLADRLGQDDSNGSNSRSYAVAEYVQGGEAVCLLFGKNGSVNEHLLSRLIVTCVFVVDRHGESQVLWNDQFLEGISKLTIHHCGKVQTGFGVCCRSVRMENRG